MNTIESESLIHPFNFQSNEKVKLTSFNSTNKDSSQDLLNRLNATNIPYRQSVDKTDVFNIINSRLFFLTATAIWSLYWFISSLFE